ncbi:acyltransferase [Microbacterium yannicii]|uniref:Acyltransferase n=1 Tax=Microbacterium yannicii TaxID=671622 RepID=A0ABP9LTN6_9MICO|nr:DapH/DapD/GlmU-related protein [Microbacterium yannicii]
MRVIGRLGSVISRWLRNVWLNTVVASDFVPEHLRWILLRASGLEVHRSIIEAGGYYGGRSIAIGQGCYINRGTFFDASAPVIVGRSVSFGMNVTVITGSHQIAGPKKRAGDLQNRAVVIGDGAWVGAGATVLPGVTIGAGAVVGAGSLVTKDVAAHTLVAGNPARVVRALDTLDTADAPAAAS